MPNYDCRCPKCNKKVLELIDLQGGTPREFLNKFEKAEFKCGRCGFIGSVHLLVIVGGED